MNIAIISPEFPPLTNWGGIATFSKNLSILLASMDHHVDVFTYTKNHSFIVKKDKVTIHYVPYKTSSKIFNFIYYHFPFTWIKKILSYLFPTTFFTLEWNFFVYLYFKKYHKKQNFEFIHTPTYHWSAFLISIFIKNIFIINHIQGTQFFSKKYEKETLDSWIKDYLEKVYIKNTSSKIICCSQHIKDKLLSKLPELSSKTKYIPNFTFLEKNKSNGNSNFKNIVFMGRLEPRKGVDILVKSFIKIASKKPKLKLFLIGKNGYGFKIKNKAVDFKTFLEKLDIPSKIRKQIFLIPNIDDRDSLIELLKILKGIAVFPSKSEPFGFVTIEAMSLGYITIAGKNGGGSEIIEEGISGFTNTVNQNSLTKKITKVLNLSPKEKNKISKAAQQRIRKSYDVNSVKNSYKNIYKNLNKFY